MVYLTDNPKVKFKKVIKTTFIDEPDFYEAHFSFLYNDVDELVYAIFTNNNGRLYLSNIERTHAHRKLFAEEHLGTELFIAALLEMTTTWKMNLKRIDGRLSSADAQSRAWDTSIPFYYNLPTYIQEHTGISYSFHIYYDKQHTQELQWPIWGDDYKSAAKAIRQKFEKTNADLYFSFLASESN